MIRIRSVPLAPEGAGILAVSFILFVITAAAAVQSRRPLWVAIAVVCGLWLALTLQFFRDPRRVTVADLRQVVSPADGKIISIGAPLESPLEGPTMRISIFMSPFNVHVNRSPVVGKVERVVHTQGKFLSAFKPEAERVNERNIVLMSSAKGRVAFSQVAGFLARRIVFHPKAGDTLDVGQRVGMIRFGSRVDLYLPINVNPLVKVGQRVTAGETIVGEFSDG